MTIRVRLDNGQEIEVATDDPQAAAAAGRKYQANTKGGLVNDITGGIEKLTQGLSLNTSDEQAGMRGGIGKAYEAFKSPSKQMSVIEMQGDGWSLGDRTKAATDAFLQGYKTNRQAVLDRRANFDTRRPIAGAALEIGGSLPAFGGVTSAGGVGALSAFSGAMSGDNLEQRAGNAALGGALGFGATKALEKVAPAVGNIFSSGADKLAKSVSRYGDEQARAALSGQQMQEAADRGITMTRGQQTGDEAQIAFEQAARRGGRGGWAQNTMKPVFDEQESQVRSAIMNVAGDAAMLDHPSQAGAIVQNALQASEGQARKGVDAAYGLVRDMGGQVPRKTGINLLEAVDRTLAQRNIDFSFRSASKLTPETYSAYDAVKQLAEKMTGKAGTTQAGHQFTDVTGIVDAPIPLSLVEQTRKLVNIAADNASAAAKMTGRREDQAAALAIRDSFDDWLDNAIDSRLLSNDVNALDALKWARGTHKAYAEKFRSNAAIRNILTKAEDPSQALNALFGVSGLGHPRGAAEAIDIIAQTAPEAHQALRQAGLMRMTEGLQNSIRQGNKTDFRQLDKLMGRMLDGDGSAVMNKLYRPEEIAELRTIREIVRKLIPPQGTVNTSSSGYEASRAVQFVFNAFRGFGARTGLNVAADAFNAGTAKAALRPPAPPMAPLPGSAGRVAAMYGAANAAKRSPRVVGPLTNLLYGDDR